MLQIVYVKCHFCKRFSEPLPTSSAPRVRWSVMQYVTVCVLQIVFVKWHFCTLFSLPLPTSSHLECVAVCCRVLQCVADYYRVLHRFALPLPTLSAPRVCCSVLQSVAVSCSVLHFEAFSLFSCTARGGVMQCVAVCCSVCCKKIASNGISAHKSQYHRRLSLHDTFFPALPTIDAYPSDLSWNCY